MRQDASRDVAALVLAGLLCMSVFSPAQAAAPPKTPPAPMVQIQTPLDSRQIAVQESNLGDLVADAVRASAQTDLALVSADEITPIVFAAGQVPASQIVHALHYSGDPADTIVILKLTGKQLQQAIERSTSRMPQPFDGFLQVSGLLVRVDPSASPSAHTILTLPNGTVVQSDQTYRVAVPHALAEGGLGYFQVWPDKKAWERDTNVSLSDALLAYLNSHPMLSLAESSRITVQKSTG